MTGAVILVVDDEVQVRRFLRATLGSHGFQCLEAATAEEGLRELAQRQPDIVLLDLSLPDFDGIEFTRRVRTWSKVPILVLSARGQEKDKIAALESGADDYLTKPFGVGELVARIKVALRHVGGADAQGEPVFASGDLRVDLSRREVHVGGKAVHLTPIEFRLLTILIQYAGRVVMQKQLLAEVWGPAASGETHYLRVHMSNLRGKIEADPAQPMHIVTEPGVGYRLMD